MQLRKPPARLGVITGGKRGEGRKSGTSGKRKEGKGKRKRKRADRCSAVRSSC